MVHRNVINSASKETQQIKVPATETDNLSLIPGVHNTEKKEKKDMALTNYSLTFTRMPPSWIQLPKPQKKRRKSRREGRRRGGGLPGVRPRHQYDN